MFEQDETRNFDGRPLYSNISDHISTEGGHAEHVLVTRISNKMDDSSTDKQIFEFSKCPRSVEFRARLNLSHGQEC